MTDQTLNQSDLKKYSKRELINLLERGKLNIMLATMTNKEDLPQYKKFSELRGKRIHLGAASRKYGIPTGTISRWVKRGYIERLGYDGQKVMVDEADIAYCASIYKDRGGPGRWLFTDDGLPYIPKN